MPVKRYNGSSWVVIAGDGAQGPAGTNGTSGIFPSTSVSSNISVAAYNNYFVDTSAARTLTVPSSPALGDQIVIVDATGSASTNNITVASNGTKIMGSVQDLIINVAYAAAVLMYTGSAYGWRVS